jgi:hypothetical protein
MSSSSLWATYMANQQKLVEIGKQIEEDKLRKAQQTADAVAFANKQFKLDEERRLQMMKLAEAALPKTVIVKPGKVQQMPFVMPSNNIFFR